MVESQAGLKKPRSILDRSENCAELDGPNLSRVFDAGPLQHVVGKDRLNTTVVSTSRGDWQRRVWEKEPSSGAR